MKSKSPAKNKPAAIALKDLKAKKNPKGGGSTYLFPVGSSVGTISATTNKGRGKF
jgi:hypothetical protein